MRDPRFPGPEQSVLRRKAEEMLAKLAVPAESGAQGEALLHELRVHQIELELQNENLRELALELETARDRYAELYELAPVGYLTLDADWRIRRANTVAATLLGRDPQGLAGVLLSRFVARESQDDLFLLGRLALSAVEPVEGQLKLQGGPPDRWILLSVAFGAANPDGVSEFRVTLIDITERVRARQLTDYRRHLEQLVDSRTSALTKALGEKEVLLREVQHRVKNNLQFVSSMLSLEAGGQRSSRSRAAFKQCQLRVEAMALVHEMLQRSGTGGRVSSRGYVQELAVSVMEAYGISPGRIILDLQIEDIPMTVDTAVPVGLILNELITNAVTHGFPGHTTGCLRVSLTRAALDRYCLVVSDDGRGMPEEVDLASPATVGLTLVLRLTEQLGGSWECSRDGGTAFTIRFHEAAPRSGGA